MMPFCLKYASIVGASVRMKLRVKWVTSSLVTWWLTMGSQMGK